MNTPTPRTDKVVASDMGDSGFIVDLIKHGQQLEQELTLARACLEISTDNTKAALNSFHAEMKQRMSAEAERDKLKNVLDQFAIPHVLERKTHGT